MSYSSLAVRILNMSAAGGEAIVPSKLQLSAENPSRPPSRDASEEGKQKQQPQSNGAVAPSSEGRGQGITFAHQDSLPKLPIPDLESTCRKYLEALYPLQTPREHEETKAAVQDFLRTDGPQLQEKLKKYASSKTSYIEQFCTCN